MKKMILALALLAGLAASTPTVVGALCSMGMQKSVMDSYDNAEDFQEQAPPVQVPTDPYDPDFNGNPGDPEPTEACTPYNKPDAKLPCTCLKQNPEGCHQGHRETESKVCNSYCWKAKCHCCRT